MNQKMKVISKSKLTNLTVVELNTIALVSNLNHRIISAAYEEDPYVILRYHQPPVAVLTKLKGYLQEAGFETKISEHVDGHTTIKIFL
ncbi:hypothetical protein [Bacillus phage SDFMU_Pbc]|uniref:Uncharacterized protein n=1 Tax=Bacillus phage SDFMU_Pbc TaxID=3076135 RepID=A0AA96KRK4_9CAUD|nr:hypothetical protein [Bacillus phage SDFMU_Pbc]